MLARLKNGLIASCQPVDDGPLDRPEIVAALAQACVAGGAAGLRIEGVENLRAVRPCVAVPVVGIVKRDLAESPVRITPFLEDVAALAAAGADIIAVDATDRARPVPLAELRAAIAAADCLAMADCATLADAEAALALGFQVIGPTLSGYTGGPVPEAPDFALLEDMARLGGFVVAEGRYNTPALAAEAIRHGADSVTVGTALTRLEHVTGWFAGAIAGAAA